MPPFNASAKQSLNALLVVIVLALSIIAPLASAYAQSSAQQDTWWNDQWSRRKKITIDASPTGVPIPDSIGNAPILVRLHAGNFGPSFQEVKPDGSDIRFVANDDKTPLSFQIERFDAAKSEALVWVKLPGIAANNKTEFWLYWRNEAAPAPTAQDGKGAFDQDTKLVYHFTENNLPAQDATVWNNASQSLMKSAPGSIIGQGIQLGGEPLAIPASPQLGWSNNAALTVMGWFKMTAAKPNAVIFSRRNQAAGFIIGIDNTVPFVEIATGTGTQRAPASVTMEAGKWYHIAAVADGALVTLYVNGAGVATLIGQVPELKTASFLGGDTPVSIPAAAPAPTASVDQSPSPEISIETQAAAATPDSLPAADQATPAPAAPSFSTNPGFTGDADEFSIHFVARPSGFIRLAAIGQGGEQMAQLITYSMPQETSIWLSGTYGVLIKSVKPLEWSIIGILGVMLFASLWITFEKFSYVGGQTKGNTKFSSRFRQLSIDLDAVDRGDDLKILTESCRKRLENLVFPLVCPPT